MAGKLYLCATPIGNLEDITMRAIRILNEADLIAAEDTRNSMRLLNHFGIKTPMTSYHEYNKYEKAYRLAEQIQAGSDVALITDAGTPGISDPGEELARICYEQGIEVIPVPGASACIAGLCASGQKTRRFAFEAFLPREKKERAEILKELAQESRTIVLYEAPHHLLKTLRELHAALGDRLITVCRELTKKFEEKRRMRLQEAAAYYEQTEIRGEFVLVIEGKSRSEIREAARKNWESTSIEEHMEVYLSQGLDKKEAMKAVAKDRGVSKRDIYSELLN